jgi:hypothetical protein
MNPLARVEYLGWGLIYGVLAALPLCGLVLFLEITQPAQLHGSGFVTTELASFNDGSAGAASSPLRHAVAHLKGVSAELGQAGYVSSDAKLFSPSDVASAFGGRTSLKAGFKTEIVTKDHRRVAIHIIRREAITDRAVPDNSRLMDIVPASTANVVSFAWGNWLYTAEVEDKGPEPEVVVQEVL